MAKMYFGLHRSERRPRAEMGPVTFPIITSFVTVRDAAMRLRRPLDWVHQTCLKLGIALQPGGTSPIMTGHQFEALERASGKDGK